ncbi:MAG TPA: glycosyltransferase family 39 protein [Candidatus Saccharimonadales bacterium]|nr:glycosyltransferase family 39 protein [Candidatus Saccharimonadales bacterium]
MPELLKFDPLPRRLTLLFLAILLFISAFLRLYNVTNDPPALYQDESAIGYNAYSILQTGKDEYGISHPLYFKSFGDYKLPVYIYFTAASIKLFGLNEFAVRFPSILAGIIAVMLIFFFVRFLTKNTTLALITALVLALNPTHLFFSRAAFEVNLALTFAVAGSYLFIFGATKKKIIYIIFSIICFCLCLYSYNVVRLFSPLLLATLIYLYWKELKLFRLSYQIGVVVLFVVLITPFLLSFFSSSGVFSAKSTLITSTDILAKDLEFRSYLTGLPHIYTALLFNKYIYMVFQYFQNLAMIISGAFYFVSGTAEQNQGVGNVGYFYLSDLPFFIWGIVTCFQAKIKSYRIFTFWLIFAVLVLGLSKEVPQATRGYFIILPSVCFIALGIFSFIRWLPTYKNTALKYALVAAVVLFAFYNIQYYFLSYYFRFPLVSADAWRTEDKSLSLYLKDNQSKYKHILIDRSADYIYTSYLFYDQYPPTEFVKTAVKKQDGDLIKADSWGNFQVVEIDWKKQLAMPHTLIITTAADTPKHTFVLKKFYDPTTYSVLSVSSTIVSAPQNDIRYVLVETDANRHNVRLLQQLGRQSPLGLSQEN